MMRMTEEQKMLLNEYEGGKTKVIREMGKSVEELKSNNGDVELLELLEDLILQLREYSNREYFRMKKELLLDPASDMDAMEVADISSKK